ncbi:rhodanese-like domain-containing protein [Sphingomonas sp.]|jgi:PQQ-dependent catabolism-associated CXXCW motif protein|uniref:rhodanese-like domain-containing protein n=1 Tax=Sphingomonas sp. TaxID=28214 RepID=UPI002ED7BB04
MSLVIALALVGAVQVAEPEGYWTGAMRGDVPWALAGARVIDDAALDRLIADERPVLIDVSPEEPRPPGNRPWLPLHRSIPDSRWLPGAGEGVLAPSRVTLLTTIAVRNRAVVIFCHPRCWASWNAAKRLVRAGHPRVFWYAAGIEGWQERHATAVVQPDSAWAASAAVSPAAPRASAGDRP